MDELNRYRVNELPQDLLPITTHFTAQHYGRRSAKNRLRRVHSTRNEQVGCVGDIDIRLPGEGHEVKLEHKIESLYALKVTDRQKIYDEHHEEKIPTRFLDKNFNSASLEYFYLADPLKDGYYNAGDSYLRCKMEHRLSINGTLLTLHLRKRNRQMPFAKSVYSEPKTKSEFSILGLIHQMPFTTCMLRITSTMKVKSQRAYEDLARVNTVGWEKGMAHFSCKALQEPVRDFMKAIQALEAKWKKNPNISTKRKIKFSRVKWNNAGFQIDRRNVQVSDEAKTITLKKKTLKYLAALLDINDVNLCTKMQDKWKAGNKDSGMVGLIRTPKREYYVIFSLTIEGWYTMESDLGSLRLGGTHPGVRSFQTIYDVDGTVKEVGVDDHLVIRQMHHSTDVTQTHFVRMPCDQHKKTGYVTASAIKSKITMAGCVIEIKPLETAEANKEEMEARERRKQKPMEEHE